MKTNKVKFITDNKLLSSIYNAAEEKEKGNLVDFNGRRAVVEGAEYRNLWLETQPMGGEMYAKRDLEAGYNNIDLFMRAQNEEGMMPGMLTFIDGVYKEYHNFIQGYCFPIHALNMYYLIGEDREFLERLYTVLKKNDAWFWANRESDGDGCLESWCPCDTGEDYAAKFNGAPHFWEEKTPPGEEWKQYHFPRESLDLMGYSHDGRRTLAMISAILGNGEEDYWNEKADEVKNKVREYLWRDDKGACYDRDENNEFLDILTHNNIRGMYFGVFDQYMADRFISEHFFNPDEFWTKMPLPSTAVNSPFFRNIKENNWSGQPEGLTFQRTIRALENYGHYAELPIVAEKLFEAIGFGEKFTQQFDPFTGKPSVNEFSPDYGPTILAALEYMSRLYGVHRQLNDIYWGAYAADGCSYDYTQTYGDTEYRIVNDSKHATAYVNGRQVFTVSSGTRVETDIKGNVKRVINISSSDKTVCLKTDNITMTFGIRPNNVVEFEGTAYTVSDKVPFFHP